VTEINTLPFIVALLIDIVSVALLAYVFYYRRHSKRDMAIAIATINFTLFALAGALASFTLSLGVGFALFAVISIIRLRSDEAGWLEMSYLLVALAVGLILGLPGYSLAVQVVYAAVLVLGMYIIDHPKVFARNSRRRLSMTVDFVELDPTELRERTSVALSGASIHEVVIKSVAANPPSMKLDVTLR
jgi:hypothetical protein